MKPANPKAAREILKTKKSQIKEKSHKTETKPRRERRKASSDNTGSNSGVGTSSPTKYQPSSEYDATDMSAYDSPAKPDQDVENDRQDEDDAEVVHKIKFNLTLKRLGV